MKKIIIIALLVTVGLIVWSLAARSRGNNPGIEYAPDMYVSKTYEAYTQLMDDSSNYHPFGGSMFEPVPGTVAVGQGESVYPFENTPEGYEQSTGLKAPFIADANGEGERLYGIYCGPCHGEKGGNDGPVFKKAKTLKPGGWDNYQHSYIRNLPAGKIYHTIMYGKNNMGSHAYALSPKERWMVVNHVKALSKMDSTGLPALDRFLEVEIPEEDKLLLSKDFADIHFETGSARLTKASYGAIEHLFTYLKEHSENQPMIVKGHTDNTGDEYNNRVLSKRRASAVKSALVSMGIPADRIYAVGYGSSMPLVANDTDDNRQKNRRVDFAFGTKI